MYSMRQENWGRCTKKGEKSDRAVIVAGRTEGGRG